MGWRKQREGDEQTVQEITDTVRRMHDEADDGPLPGTDDES